jgi:hypothetical protein
MSQDRPEVTVVNNEAEHQYEAHIDGRVAGLATYVVKGDRVVFPHTEVDSRWEGLGVGGQLVGFALDDVVAAGRRIVADCPFVAHYVEEHQAYADHTAPRD